MKIKRYLAESMRAALAQVRVEQGADAVILSSRRVDDGIEVIAAMDYDEALFQGAMRRPAPGPSNAVVEDISDPAPAETPASGPAATAVAPAASAKVSAPAKPAASLAARAKNTVQAVAGVVLSKAAATPALKPAAKPDVVSAPVQDPKPKARHSGLIIEQAAADRPVKTAARDGEGGNLQAMQAELADLRELMQGSLRQLSWSDKRLREPLQARVLEQLAAMDIAPDVALTLAAGAPRRTTTRDAKNLPLALLLRHLRVVDGLTPVNSGVIALVGPTGAGKTTTIAKLAASWSMRHGCRDLALVSTDGYRIGAREQLMMYARILGAPMHTANGSKDLARLLERLSSKKLVLIDTAGMAPRDARLTEQLAALKSSAPKAQVLLALPAQAEAHALEETVRSFARISPVACVLTKIDEAASLGAVLSTSLRHKLRIAYVCDGQRVPEDLHAAHERRVWLLQYARKLKERRPTPVNEAVLAKNFGEVPAHA